MEKRNGPPRSVSIPQASSSDVEIELGGRGAAHREPPTPMVGQHSLPVDDTEMENKFDLMKVNVTVYALTGILCRTQDVKTTRRERKRSLDLKSPPPEPKSLGSPRPTASSSKVTEGSSMRSLDSAPVTAVVSLNRQVVSSGFAMETYLPSMPLQVHESTTGDFTRCNAFWWEDDSTRLLNWDQVEPSTFEITRVMQREHFHPVKKIGHISNYVHERIDLNVSVGKGREMIPLGTASLALTGDEEGEVITSVPVKSVAPRAAAAPRRKMRFKSPENKRSKGRKRQSFCQDPRHVYALDENATLRVGIRVVPARLEEEATARERRLTLDCAAVDDDEGNDENAIILDFEGDALVAKRAEEKKAFFQETTRSKKEAAKTPEARSGGFFFCACTAPTVEEPPRERRPLSPTKQRRKLPKDSKKIGGEVQKLRVMSDVSDSTGWTDYESVYVSMFKSNRNQRAEI
jgi:hypothetical protein